MIPLGVLASSRVTSGGGGFSPASIPGLDLWLDAASLSLATGDPVPSWPDLSGAGNTATQAAGAQQPAFSTALGYPSVYFDGARRMSTTASASGAAQTAFWVATVGDSAVRTPLGASGTTAFALDFGGILRVRARLWGSALSASSVGAASSVGVPTAGMGRYIGPDGITVQKIGLSAVSATLEASPTAGRTLQVGAKGSGAEYHLGHIAEIIHYSAALSDAQIADVFAYLSTKYSL